MNPLLLMIAGTFTLMMAAGVVLSRNAIYSAFCLILCFFGLASIYVLWSATFIAAIQVLIYTGAIVVLFVFVVMLLNLSKHPALSYGSIAIVLTGGMIWLFSFVLLRTLTMGLLTGPISVSAGSIKGISKALFTQYLWPFEALSVFLLAMTVAVYVLAKEEGAEST